MAVRKSYTHTHTHTLSLTHADFLSLSPYLSLPPSLRLVLERTGLRSLRGLSALESVGGKLSILSNSYISSIGMNSLKRIGTTLGIKYNMRLQSLSGLDFLTQVGGSVDIQLNQRLANLTGLEVRGVASHLHMPHPTTYHPQSRTLSFPHILVS